MMDLYQNNKRLSDDEIDFIEQIEAGSSYWPAVRKAGGRKRQPAVISGALVRAIMLGIAVTRPDRRGVEYSCPVALTPAGLRIERPEGCDDGYVHIAGKLDLRFVTMGAGQSLAPLLLTHCHFAKPIDLRDASFAILSLHGSRFTDLQLQDSMIAGQLDLSACGPLPNPVHDPDRKNMLDQADYWPFKGSLFKEVKDDNGQIDGLAVLDELNPSSDEDGAVTPGAERPALMWPEASSTTLACCRVRMTNCRVDGNCSFAGGSFVTSRDGNDSNSRGVALDLIGIHVIGTLNFTRTVVIGGISLKNCNVEEDIWFVGSRILAYRRTSPDLPEAINLQHGRVLGGLVFRRTDQIFQGTNGHLNDRAEFVHNIILGNIFALGFRSKSLWIGASLVWGDGVAVCFNDCQVDGTVTIGSYNREGRDNATLIDGLCYFDHAVVGGNFLINHAGLTRPGSAMLQDLLKIRNHFHAEILGYQYFDGQLFSFSMTGSQITKALEISRSRFQNGVDASLDLWKSGAAQGFRVDANCTFSGAIRINRTQWGKNVSIKAAQIIGGTIKGHANGTVAIDATGMVVDGDLTIGGSSDAMKATGKIALSGCRVAGDVALRNMALSPGTGHADDVPTLLTIESSEFAGDLKVDGLNWMKGRQAGFAHGLDHRDMGVRKLSFYPDAYLLERRDGDQIRRAVYFPEWDGPIDQKLHFLSGASQVIHGMNRNSAAPLKLETQAQRRDYLTFFCDNVHGEKGGFRIVNAIDDGLYKMADQSGTEGQEATPTVDAGANLATGICPPESLDETRSDKGQPLWPFRVTLVYDSHIFNAVMHLHPDGNVEMIDDRQFGTLETPLPPDQGGNRPAQMPEGVRFEDYASGLTWPLRTFTAWRLSHRLRKDSNNAEGTPTPDGQEPVHAYVDMRRASCAFLDDNAGTGWGLDQHEGLQLRLHGFSCATVEPENEVNDASAGNENDKTVGQPKEEFNESTKDRDWGKGVFRQSVEEKRAAWLRRQFPLKTRASMVMRLMQAIRGVRLRSLVFPAYPIGKEIIPESWARPEALAKDNFVPHTWDDFAARHLRVGEIERGHFLLAERKEIAAWLSAKSLKAHLWTGRRPVILAALIALPVLASLWPGEHPQSLLGQDWQSLGLLSLVPLFALALPILRLIGNRLFAIGFRYGLSERRAISVFMAMIAIGAIATHKARTGSFFSMQTNWAQLTSAPDEVSGGQKLRDDIALVLQASYEPDGSPNENAGSKAAPSGASNVAIAGSLVYAKAAPCNLGVSSILYAADVFIPVLDLEQENRCTVREEEESKASYAAWRWAKVLYEMLGWIVTSLTILTITGVMRRDLER